jgi:sugar transferase (PEP-CTERM/EpsH1 system associated)
MKILYIAHRIPYPPDKGDKIRSFHQIQHLSRTHEIYLACLADEKKDLEHSKALEKYCASVDVVYRDKRLNKCRAFLSLITKMPLSVAYFYSSELNERIARRLRLERIDRIFVYSSTMAEYVRRLAGIPKVMDFVDVDSEKWRLYAGYQPFPLSSFYRLEADRLVRYEREVARVFDRSLFVSEQEAVFFKQLVKDRPVSVIPNGVDLDYFASNGNLASYNKNPVMAFTGSMDYFPNVDAMKFFSQKVLPLIKESLPEAQLNIIGRNPTPAVKELGRQRNVIVTGTVPDVRPYLAKAKIAVAPFRIARGVQNKILEAMAMSLPVVGTSLAFQGIQATPADGVRIADDPKAIAQEVTKLLKDHDLYLECSRQVRKYVERQHRWQDHGTRLESLLKDVC